MSVNTPDIYSDIDIVVDCFMLFLVTQRHTQEQFISRQFGDGDMVMLIGGRIRCGV